MKKGVFAVLSLLFVVLVLAGCAPKELSEEEQKALEAELNQLSDEELDQAIKAVETKDTGALAGQAYYKKLPTVQSKIPKIGSPTLPKDTFLATAKKVQQARVKVCAPGPTGKIKCEFETEPFVRIYAVKEFQNVDCSTYLATTPPNKAECSFLGGKVDLETLAKMLPSQCVENIGCCKQEQFPFTCEGNTIINQSKNPCSGGIITVQKLKTCSEMNEGDKKYTCPQNLQNLGWGECVVCGAPICEKDDITRAAYTTCEDLYPKGWKDTGEVVTGPGCQ